MNKYLNSDKNLLTKNILNSNSKKTKLFNERNDQIDRENHMLVEKMSKIISNKKPNNYNYPNMTIKELPSARGSKGSPRLQYSPRKRSIPGTSNVGRSPRGTSILAGEYQM